MGTEGLPLLGGLWLLLWVQLCRGAAEVRLVNGGGRCVGRVEVKHEEQWGTVCDSDWDKKDATVVCRQLGCGVALRAHTRAHFGQGSGPVWMNRVACRGSEAALSDCPHAGWRELHCTHNWDAGVTCSGFVRLVGGDNPCSGQVEIHDRDQWRTVCASDFGPEAAAVVCRELQCGAALAMPASAGPGEGGSAMRERELQCVGNESLLASCPRGSPRDQPCAHHRNATVTCTPFRLVNGSTACEGRVEFHVLGTWGTLCASHWDLNDGHVLCRHLNCGFAEAIPPGGSFGEGTVSMWRDSFHCNGTETHMEECPVTVLGASPCAPGNAAAVVCSGPAIEGSLRLVGGESRCDGRVEILLQRGTWGRVLAGRWELPEAAVVCRQLRCGEAETADTLPRGQRGAGPVGLRGVRCAGHEARLSLCNASSPLPDEVLEDVGVSCRGEWRCGGTPGGGRVCAAGSRSVRLASGAGRCEGRVEILHRGAWGTVCDDGWDLRTAAVVCRQLGCGAAINASGSERFGEGHGPIWLDGVNCSGHEAALWDCPAEPWGRHDCGHKEDAGVVCSEFVALRLENSDGCSGRLRVLYNGTWGSVCSNLMTPKAAVLACKELGCGDKGHLEGQQGYGKVEGPAWLDQVECGKTARSFWECLSTPWHPQSCEDVQEEAHITCTDREKIRVVGGESNCSGRVELWHRGSWGTVCDDSWDMRDAQVVCRQLGCGPAVAALPEAAFGEGTGAIWLERVECRGTELALQDCWARPGDGGLCRHKEDAAVSCSGGQRGWHPSEGRDKEP
ncbi:C163A protein, partial [Grallaria varia]|nr:C163A protein [Grallaria varia]